MVDFKNIVHRLERWQAVKNTPYQELGYFEVKERESLPRVLRQDVEELIAAIVASDPASAIHDHDLRRRAGSLVLDIVKAL